MIRAVGVVVPARDEERLLPACLESLAKAACHPALAGVGVEVVCVLDGCTDGSAAAVADAGVAAVVVDVGNVGAARAAGFEAVLRRLDGYPADQVWLATTDADSTVPRDWLARQLRSAADGADLVVGTVRVADWSGHPARVLRRFAELYGADESGPHRHVHGANLGLRASAYEQVGGVPQLALAEDHALVDAFVAHRLPIVRTRDIPVTTSARRTARARGGFADLLLALADSPRT